MSDVKVEYGESARDTAVLLLAAAEKAGLDPSVVRISPEDGVFYAPEEVAKKAKVDFDEGDEPEAQSTEEEVPAKKAAAKKATAKKSTE